MKGETMTVKERIAKRKRLKRIRRILRIRQALNGQPRLP